MPLPWQHTFCHCPKMCPTHLHFKGNMCAKFNKIMLFPSIVGIICYHGNTFSPILKIVSCTSTPEGQHVNPISFEFLVKFLVFSFWNNTLLPWQRTSRPYPKMCHAQLHFNVNMYAKFDLKCISPSIFGIICRFHGNTLSSTVKKCILHNYTIQLSCVPNFTLNA